MRDFAAGQNDPSVTAGYYQPLIDELDQVTQGKPVRIEVPPTRNRYEANYVAPHFPLARGWLRQSESGDFDLFTGDNLTADSYLAWLQERGVSYVALADADPDYLAQDESDLIRGGLPYLRRCGRTTTGTCTGCAVPLAWCRRSASPPSPLPEPTASHPSGQRTSASPPGTPVRTSCASTTRPIGR